jgi:hypothetical protein
VLVADVSAKKWRGDNRAVADLAAVAGAASCTIEPEHGGTTMIVTFVTAGDHSVVVPLHGFDVRDWYETQVRAGARNATVTIGDCVFHGKASGVNWQGVYEVKNAYSEKYRDAPRGQRKLTIPAVWIDLKPDW